MELTLGEERKNRTVEATARPYRWGIFQSTMSVLLGIATFVAAYKYPQPWKTIDFAIALIHFVVCVGLGNKKRYGFVAYYVLTILACMNYARLMTVILLRRTPALGHPLSPSLFLLVGILIGCWWIVPAILYYPKRWNEFS